MRIHLWGTDFRRSNSDFRSQLYLSPENKQKALQDLYALGFDDLLYLNTCNRIEFYTTAPTHYADMRSQWLKLLKYFNLDEDNFYQGYALEGKSALRHLLRVSSSLESMVVGEPQILGQLKEALSWSLEQNFKIDISLQKNFKLAFEVAKRIRTETQLGSHPVSVTTLAIQKSLEKETQYPFENVVVVGRSPIQLQVLSWLTKNRPSAKILWVNRSLEKLEQYKEFSQIEKMSLEDFIKKPLKFSHLFSATSSKEIIFSKEFFKALEFKSLLIDLAEPHDIEENDFETIRLQHLKELAQKNKSNRMQEIEKSEKIIEEALKQYFQSQKEAPLLKEFVKVENILIENLKSELSEKSLKKVLHHSKIHLKQVLQDVAHQKSI
jgi:glutamyl-tRNA reductase